MEENLDVPQDFKCPISMELMKDPVTISTGVTYERKNIMKWFFTYRKRTCPATMQAIETFEITPNHTLKRLIISWADSRTNQNVPIKSSKHDELVAILGMIDSTPFKVSSLRKLRGLIEMGDEMKEDLKRLGGIEVLVKTIEQVLAESCDFEVFRASEEALRVLHLVEFSEDDEMILHRLMDQDCMKAMAIMLQRGSEEARFCSILIFRKLGNADYQWNYVAQEQGIEFFKSLLEILSDENCTKASSCALQLLIEILDASKKSRLKAIEAGAICTLIELLPDANRAKCEKIMQLIKLMCECADGRQSLSEHGLGIAAVSKKMLNVSNCVTKTSVKILWLLSSFHSRERVLEEMLLCGAVKRLIALLQIDGSGLSTVKEYALKIFKLHGGVWRRNPCFPSEWRSYLAMI